MASVAHGFSLIICPTGPASFPTQKSGVLELTRRLPHNSGPADGWQVSIGQRTKFHTSLPHLETTINLLGSNIIDERDNR